MYNKVLTNIKCNDCNKILPPHTEEEHLDINHPVHNCPEHNNNKNAIISDECPICYEKYSDNKIADSIHNTGRESNCRHYFCMDCLYQMGEKSVEEGGTIICCPICREDLTQYIYDYYIDESDDESV